MQIAPGVHHFPTGPFNWYVLEEAGRLTLIDAGFPGHYATFREGLASIGKTEKDVEAVLLTHAHADHMGFADRVAQAAKAPVYVHPADIPAAQRILQLPWVALLSQAWRPYMAGMLSYAVLNGVFTPARIPTPRPLPLGKPLDVPGHPIAIAAPGHTAGEVAFLLPDRGVLVSGDVLVTRDLYSGQYGDPQVTRPALNLDYKQALASLDALKTLGPIKMLPGHGRPWQGDAAEAVRLARQAARS